MSSLITWAREKLATYLSPKLLSRPLPFCCKIDPDVHLVTPGRSVCFTSLTIAGIAIRIVLEAQLTTLPDTHALLMLLTPS